MGDRLSDETSLSCPAVVRIEMMGDRFSDETSLSCPAVVRIEMMGDRFSDEILTLIADNLTRKRFQEYRFVCKRTALQLKKRRQGGEPASPWTGTSPHVPTPTSPVPSTPDANAPPPPVRNYHPLPTSSSLASSSPTWMPDPTKVTPTEPADEESLTEPAGAVLWSGMSPHSPAAATITSRPDPEALPPLVQVPTPSSLPANPGPTWTLDPMPLTPTEPADEELLTPTEPAGEE